MNWVDRVWSWAWFPLALVLGGAVILWLLGYGDLGNPDRNAAVLWMTIAIVIVGAFGPLIIKRLKGSPRPPRVVKR
jgi:hypothetical protein